MDVQQQESGNLSTVVIPLLKGVVYQDSDAALWNSLLRLQPQVRDYVAVLGLDLQLDEAEGYAFLRSKPEPTNEETRPIPRLIVRRPLSFPVSLLLALLRKKMAEFDTGGSETRLVLSRDEIAALVGVFLPEGTNEARMRDQVGVHINKIVDLGFLRPLNESETFEVQRILKAFVDAQWLAEFDQRLESYRVQLHTQSADTDD